MYHALALLLLRPCHGPRLCFSSALAMDDDAAHTSKPRWSPDLKRAVMRELYEKLVELPI